MGAGAVVPIFEPRSWLNPDFRPEWWNDGSIGRFAVSTDRGRFDRHHHDAHEAWLISEGKAKIFFEGAEHYVQAGDIVVTQAGDVHDVVEVYETLRGFFIELAPPAGRSTGHLDTVAHDVPALPVPHDFPDRP